ncbi:heme ABC transporter ATP-binding protein [Pedobacter hiemivivus]|uniref:Heme ABC transporter ATP-binding protein n=1 Tax=Pedobacter hiemivivus TaxID=2530454 RepID=A0A4U1GI58_9SPHI|nr:heme ABC transporter ATP-binding protein [Pedobacter hiemivivus]TKC63947.1 heme ABC transporter ATP-binding protein [Pedobacter hiemivivus]
MLIADSLTFEIGKRSLVKDISFSIRPGELLIILGANGAGKSSLFRLLSGEKMPTRGHIQLHGKEIVAYTVAELALKRGVLNQQNIVNMAFTVMEIVMMGRYPHYSNSPAVKDIEIAQQVMELTGVIDFADRSYLTLSGGEQQRVQLARVLAQIWDVPNALLLMDEPVASLDLQYQQQTLAIAKMLSKRGFMVVSILHDINLAGQYADRIIMLKNGRKWYDGTAAEVLSSKNIYDVFEINSDVYTNPRTLKHFFIPRNVSLNINSQ